MRIPLHIKTTILASVAIIFVMAITFVIFGVVVVQQMQNEQKEYAEAQAENLAEKIADVLPLNNFDLVLKRVQILDSAKRYKTEKYKIRVWEIYQTNFNKRIETGNGDSISELSFPVENALLNRQEVKIDDKLQGVYRVFVPVILNARVVGSVEFAEDLDTFSTLAERFWILGFSLVLAFIILSALSIYILTKFFINRPLNKITAALHQARDGKLKARAEVISRDEIGILGRELNKMLDKIEQFTVERERQNEILEGKVKEATVNLEKRNEQLETANKEIWRATNNLSKSEKLAAAGQTAAQFAHEVGTPLNLISGHVQLLQKQFDADDAARKRLDIIGSQIGRIETIVHSMLDKTRLDDVAFETIDANKVLENIIQIVAPKLEAEKIEITFNAAEKLFPIKANAERLQQVFLNLINNAADAMPNGGELRITTENIQEQMTVEISDTGTGMSEETQKHIFEPLFTTKERGQGTGLGLVVVKQILNEHNAAIKIKSCSPGKGTSFITEFPAV